MFQPGPAISVSNRNLSRAYDTHPTIKLSQFRTPVGVFREETRFLYSQLQCLLELTTGFHCFIFIFFNFILFLNFTILY